MSEIESVTTKTKEKSPGRVAWGKKLAVVSAETKKRKKLQTKSLDSNAPSSGDARGTAGSSGDARGTAGSGTSGSTSREFSRNAVEEPETSNEVGSNEVGSVGSNGSNGPNNFTIILALGSLVIGAGALYYTRQTYFGSRMLYRTSGANGTEAKTKKQHPTLQDDVPVGMSHSPALYDME